MTVTDSVLPLVPSIPSLLGEERGEGGGRFCFLFRLGEESVRSWDVQKGFVLELNVKGPILSSAGTVDNHQSNVSLHLDPSTISNFRHGTDCGEALTSNSTLSLPGIIYGRQVPLFL